MLRARRETARRATKRPPRPTCARGRATRSPVVGGGESVVGRARFPKSRSVSSDRRGNDEARRSGPRGGATRATTPAGGRAGPRAPASPSPRSASVAGSGTEFQVPTVIVQVYSQCMPHSGASQPVMKTESLRNVKPEPPVSGNATVEKDCADETSSRSNFLAVSSDVAPWSSEYTTRIVERAAVGETAVGERGDGQGDAADDESALERHAERVDVREGDVLVVAVGERLARHLVLSDRERPDVLARQVPRDGLLEVQRRGPKRGRAGQRARDQERGEETSGPCSNHGAIEPERESDSSSTPA